MIRVVHRAGDGQIRSGLPLSDLASALQDAEGLLWVNLATEPAEVCDPILRETFAFHPLAVEDALEQSHVPKVDDWGSYLFLNLHAVAFDRHADEMIRTLELDLFVGPNYLVTHQITPIAAVDRVWTSCQRDPHHLQLGVARLLHELADELAADYMPVVDQIDEEIDRIEDEVFGSPGPHLLERIFRLKRVLLHLRRILSPQREVLNKLSRGDFAVINDEDRMFFRDVYDHLVRLYDISDGLRDLLGGALDTYLSVVNNRMNQVMKILTVITTLFMPISFLVGFFGTNFFQPVASLNAWTDRPAFVAMVVAVLLLPAAMYLWMRRRAWM